MDGTKIKANASRHKAMSYGRMGSAETSLEAKIRAGFVEAERIDAAEDAAHGPAQDGEPVPDWMGDAVERLARIRRAKTDLEAEACQMRRAAQETPKDAAMMDAAMMDPTPKDAAPKGAETTGREQGGDDGPGPSSGMRERGKARPCADGVPPAKAQRNFTDPDSRVQPTKNDGSSPAVTRKPASTRQTRSSCRKGSPPTRPTSARWCPWWTRRRQTLDARQRRSRATAVLPARPISRRWRRAALNLISRRAAPNMARTTTAAIASSRKARA